VIWEKVRFDIREKEIESKGRQKETGRNPRIYLLRGEKLTVRKATSAIIENISIN
jgi:hypothetical protein